MNSYPRDPSSLRIDFLCSVSAHAPRLVSSIFPPALPKLHGNTTFSSRIRNAASQLGLPSIAARVPAAHTPLSSLARCSLTSSRVEVHRAFPGARSFLSHCSSPTLMMRSHSVRLSWASGLSFPRKTECLIWKKFVNHLRSRVSGQSMDCRVFSGA